LAHVLERASIAATTLGAELARLIESPVPTADIVDICSFSLLEDPAFKQQLLSDSNVARRVKSAVDAISALHPPAPPRRFGDVSMN
jgi:hypothetical protein